MVDNGGAVLQGLLHKHPRIPAHPVGIPVIAEGEIRLPAVLVHVLVQQPPVVPQADGAVHNAPRHGRHHLVLQRGDRQFAARFRDFVAYMDAVFFKHFKRGREAGSVIENRAAARAHRPHHAQQPVGDQDVLAGDAEPFEGLPGRAFNGLSAAPFQHQHPPLAPGKFPRNRGAARSRSNNNSVVFPACRFHKTSSLVCSLRCLAERPPKHCSKAYCGNTIRLRTGTHGEGTPTKSHVLIYGKHNGNGRTGTYAFACS